MLRQLCAIALAISPLAGQNLCAGNLVTNGDFSSVFPPWTLTAGTSTVTYPTARVNIADDSRCLQVTRGTATLLAPGTFAVANRTYSITADVFRFGGFSGATTLDFGLLHGSNRQSIGQARLGGDFRRSRHSRVALLFKVPAAANCSLDVQISTSATTQLDNIVIQPHTDLLFNVDAPQRQLNASNSFRIAGAPRQTVAVLVAPQTVSPIRVPGFSHALTIGPVQSLFVAVNLVTLNSSGEFAGTIRMPVSAPRTVLHWQPVGVTPEFDLGCSSTIAF